jgi:hypothetical protein
MKKLFCLILSAALVPGCGGSRTGEGDGAGDGDLNIGEGWDGQDLAPDQFFPDGQPDVVQPEIPESYEPELCGMEEFNIARIIPDVLILLDRSNSMSFTPPTPPLWNTIRTAISTVTAAMDDAIWFGLMSFPNSVPPNACAGTNDQCTAPASTAILVPVGPDTSDAINSTLMSLTTCGGTPTAMSLQSASDYIATLTDDHPKYIILATDGAPNCNAGLDGNTCRCTGDNCWLNNLNCLDDLRTYGVLQGLCVAGVKTYVLGMGGATSWTDILQLMSEAGCTDTPFAAENPEAIQTALDTIAGAVASCQFEMNCADIPDTTKVNFYFDEVVVPRDPSHASGWDWTDPCDSTSDPSGMIEFFGVDCDKIMNREVTKVSATFGCPTHMI